MIPNFHITSLPFQQRNQTVENLHNANHTAFINNKIHKIHNLTIA